jgi:hypothetical protein
VIVPPRRATTHHPEGVIADHPGDLETARVAMRRIGVAALLVLGTLFWIAFGLGVWTNRQALDTDNWVDTSGELLQEEAVRTALGSFIVEQLYSSEAAEQRLEEVLPPRLAQLAGPAAAGLKEIARRNAPRLLGTDAALTAWEAANRAAHQTLLAIVEGDLGERAVSLDLKSLFGEVAAGTGLPPEVAERIPPNIASLQVASADDVGTVRELLDLFKTIVWVLLGLAMAAFAGAIALARDRRRMVVTVGGCLMFAGIAVLAIRSLAGKALVEALAEAPNAHGVADDVWQISTSLLVDAAHGSFLIGLFVVLGAWLAGSGRRATVLRRAGAHPLRERAAAVWAALGVLLLLLVIWGPVPWTQRLWPMLIFAVGACAWLAWIRRRTLAEFPNEPPPRLGWPWRRPGATAATETGGTTQ